jgi:hypothetical protein
VKRLSELFGRYSLPSVMGRLGHSIGGLFHHDSGGEPGNYPISQVNGLTQQPFTTYNNFNTSGFTDPSVSGGDPSAPLGGNPFVNSQYHAPPQSNPFGNSSGGSSTLGGGVALDPSFWGALGFGGTNTGNSAVAHATQFMPGMGEGLGGRGHRSGLYGQLHSMGTGGNLPANGGINPGGMYTGGNTPAQPMTMGTGGALQPQTGLPAYMGGPLPPHGMG